jgi:hypothetical protein
VWVVLAGRSADARSTPEPIPCDSRPGSPIDRSTPTASDGSSASQGFSSIQDAFWKSPTNQYWI